MEARAAEIDPLQHAGKQHTTPAKPSNAVTDDGSEGLASGFFHGNDGSGMQGPVWQHVGRPIRLLKKRNGRREECSNRHLQGNWMQA